MRMHDEVWIFLTYQVISLVCFDSCIMPNLLPKMCGIVDAPFPQVVITLQGSGVFLYEVLLESVHFCCFWTRVSPEFLGIVSMAVDTIGGAICPICFSGTVYTVRYSHGGLSDIRGLRTLGDFWERHERVERVTEGTENIAEEYRNSESVGRISSG